MFINKRLSVYRNDNQWPIVLMLGLVAWLLATAPLRLGAAALAGAVLVTLVLIRPVRGLYLLALAIPFGTLRSVTLGPARVGGTEAWLGLIVVAWLAQRAARGRFGDLRVPLRWPLALFLGLALFSTLWADSLSASLKELVKWGEVATLYFFVASETKRKDVLGIVLAFVLAGTLAAGQGIFQSLTRHGPPGFLFPLAGHIFLRAYSTFEQPNPFAGYLGLTVPLAYGLLLGVWSWSRAQGREVSLVAHVGRQSALAIVVGAAMAVMGLAMLLTLSRGAWLGLAAALGIMSMLVSRRTAAIVALGALLTSAALLLNSFHVLPPSLVERATNFLPYVGAWDIARVEITPQSFALVERLAHWRAAWLMFAAHPWSGVGFGNYAVAYPAVALPDWTDPLGHAHNYYLNVLAELGLGGLLAYLALWGAALRMAWQAIRRNHGLERGIAAGILGMFIHLSVHNFVDNLYVHGLYLQIAVGLGLLAVLARGPVTGLDAPASRGAAAEG